MNFSKEITTLKNTPQSSAMKTEIRLTEGFLREGWIYFPPGPAGLLHCQLYHEAVQIAPANRDASFNMADILAPFDIHLQLKNPPFLVTVYTWNLSTLYDHSLTIYLNLQEARGRTAADLSTATFERAAALLDSVK